MKTNYGLLIFWFAAAVFIAASWQSWSEFERAWCMASIAIVTLMTGLWFYIARTDLGRK